MCAAPAHEIVCMSAMYKTRGADARVGVFLSAARCRSAARSIPRARRTSGGGAVGVPRGRRRGRVRPWSCRWPLSVHPAGRRVVARGPCPGMAVARRAAGAGPLTWATAGRGGRPGAARGASPAPARVRDGSATTSTSRDGGANAGGRRETKMEKQITLWNTNGAISHL